jgi:hypothetical protein
MGTQKWSDIRRPRKIWVVTSSGDVTAWSSREKAVEMLVRDQLESARRDVVIYEAGQQLYRWWLDWFDGKGPRPPKTVWEVERLDQHPEWPARPEIMAELRLSIEKRYIHEQQTIANMRAWIADLERGIPREDEFGDRIMEWTLDVDVPQAHENYD